MTSAIRPEIREQVEGIFDGYGFDQGVLFGAVCAALTVSADHIASLEAALAASGREADTIRDELRLAIAIGPRCGNESLYHVIKWREQGLTLETIAKNVGITKAAVWNALHRAKAALPPSHEEGDTAP